MKLLTHNFLSSRFLKNVTNGYPLILRANQIANKEVEFNENFVLNMMPKLHRVMLCVEIVDGELECPDTGRKFPIKDGIPNLLVNENEV
ncbi:hypothetical protein TELCIR_11045 [Teladorsagia circumcincta]|uniref:Multifunctional methyltransferase subunit TRM112-like protein n=1 Tax=Teladorsagia circumcincta TaxID=45464 RepID=A0A2G9UAE6_TELCI|nr:hypothetical protein TELCIR_11045 [Teladorsagia circumcincta]